MDAAGFLPRATSDANLEPFLRSQPSVPVSHWDFASLELPDENQVPVGADLRVDTLLDAYVHGWFPMPVGRGKIGWFSPDPRGIMPLADVHVSRSLRKSCRTFDVTVDRDFEATMRGCADPRRDHGWIDDSVIAAYSRLHELGWAHSVEIRIDDRLVGGLYGVRIGSFFAGESMFHRVTDASKAAVVATAAILRAVDGRLFDVQWTTPHLVSLGAVDVPRADYLRTLAEAWKTPTSRQTDRHG